jgi:fructan beta-fructosidase
MKSLCIGLLACVAMFGGAKAAETYSEPFRPQFHFTPEKNWMNDPNGMVYFAGEYHLFYQYNPFGDKWGHMSWGHAVSKDMVHWDHLPLALPEENGVMIFSGSAVIDWKNTSGFGVNGQPPMVAIYTGHYTTKPLQNQHIAYSNDKGRTWKKFEGNPVLDIGEKDFRDPKVHWDEATQRWIMTIAWCNERKVRFYASDNLRDWSHLSNFGPAGSTTGIWECPDLFPLTLHGKTKWVLIVNVGGGAPAGGSGCQYFIGDFDGRRFKLDEQQPESKALWADFGPDFYAAVSWSDVPKMDGRRLWLGWMSNWMYAGDVPTSPWRSAMSIPRELGLKTVGSEIRLTQQPIRELEKLRGKAQRFKGGSVSEANEWLRANKVQGNLMELAVQFDAAPGIGKRGLKVLRGGNEETVVRLEDGRVSIDRSKSGKVDFKPDFAKPFSAPVGSGPVTLRVFVDVSSVEVFVNDGETVLTGLVLPSATSQGMEFFEEGAVGKISKIEAWPLKSSWRR